MEADVTITPLVQVVHGFANRDVVGYKITSKDNMVNRVAREYSDPNTGIIPEDEEFPELLKAILEGGWTIFFGEREEVSISALQYSICD